MCGIFGIVSKRPDKFDYDTFCTLGVANDERGGDSCGIFIDGKYEYGVNNHKLFRSFFKDSKILQETNTAKIAFGHCRKASVGAINEKTAQPVIIKNPNSGDVEFVLMHNGTIHNYYDLAKKYIPDTSVVGMTDSQVMAQIFYNCGYDVLKEYNGGAVFAIVDYRNNKNGEVLFFKGASILNSYDKTPTEERPLYVSFEKNRIVFSSILEFLSCRKRANVFTITPNELITTDGSNIFLVEKYDRSNACQYKRLLDNYYAYGYNKDYDYNYNYYSGSYNYNRLGSSSQDMKLLKENNSSNDEYITSNDDGTYSVGRHYAHGVYTIRSNGAIESFDKRKDKDCALFFFWEGVMLFSKECYKFLKKVCKAYNCTEGQLIEELPLLVRSLSPDPFIDDQQFSDNKFLLAQTADCIIPFPNGQWQFFMSNKVFCIDADGTSLCDWEFGPNYKEATFNDYKKLCAETSIDFSTLIEEYQIY